MKNIIRFFGNLNKAQCVKVPILLITLAAIAAFSITSCDIESKGGTFELVNGTGVTIYYRFSTSNSVNSVSTSLSDGSKATLKLSEDGKVYYAWAYSISSFYLNSGVEDIAGGETVTITAY